MVYIAGLDVLKTIGVNSKEQNDPLFQESLFRTYTLLNRLQELIQTGDLAVDCITLERLIQQLIKLQGVGHPKHSNNYRLHNVLMALRHPYTRYISQNYSKLLSALDEQKQFYPTRQFLSMDGDEGLSLLFKDLGETATENEYNLRLIQYLLDILKTIGVNVKNRTILYSRNRSSGPIAY